MRQSVPPKPRSSTPGEYHTTPEDSPITLLPQEVVKRVLLESHTSDLAAMLGTSSYYLRVGREALALRVPNSPEERRDLIERAVLLDDAPLLRSCVKSYPDFDRALSLCLGRGSKSPRCSYSLVGSCESFYPTWEIMRRTLRHCNGEYLTACCQYFLGEASQLGVLLDSYLVSRDRPDGILKSLYEYGLLPPEQALRFRCQASSHGVHAALEPYLSKTKSSFLSVFSGNQDAQRAVGLLVWKARELREWVTWDKGDVEALIFAFSLTDIVDVPLLTQACKEAGVALPSHLSQR